MNNDNIMNETQIFKLYVLFTFYNERYIQRYCIYVCYLNVNFVKNIQFSIIFINYVPCISDGSLIFFTYAFKQWIKVFHLRTERGRNIILEMILWMEDRSRSRRDKSPRIVNQVYFFYTFAAGLCGNFDDVNVTFANVIIVST